MKKFAFLLILIWISALSTFANTNNTDEKFDLTAKIEKGDWFRLEFATQLEDYSTPVDSIDYCKLIDLKLLVLKCEVTEISSEKIDLKFSFERIFHLKGTGEYADSYFSRGNIRNQKDFSISAKINIVKDTIDYLMPELLEEYYPYALFKRKVDFDNSTITSLEYADHLYFEEVKHLIDAFLKDWKQQNYQTPMLSFGNANATDFKKYRILDSNLPIKSNIQLEVSFVEAKENDTIEISTANSFYSYFEFDEKHIVAKKVESGICQIDFYLEQQKVLAMNYKGQKIKFLATPGQTVYINIGNKNEGYPSSVVSDNIGDQKYVSILSNPDNSFVLNSGNLNQINSIDSTLAITEKELNLKIKNLNQFKNEMSANWYKKQLMELYYWTAQSIVRWYGKNNKSINYSQLASNTAFATIHPLFDYYLQLENYDSYLLTITMNSFLPSIESVATNHGFTRSFDQNENYEIYNTLYWGYPKYYTLKNIVIQNLTGNGISLGKKNYVDFMENCKYPPFIEEVQKVYSEVERIEPGKSALDLDLNFLDHGKFNLHHDKYKIIKFIPFNSDLHFNQLLEDIKNTNENLESDKSIELYIVTHKKISDEIKLVIPNNTEGFEVKLIELKNQVQVLKDIALLHVDFNRMIILSPENKIVSRNGVSQNIRDDINHHINSQNQPKSHEGRKALLLGIFISIMGSTLVAWIIIKLNSRQIKKREATRRKLSELELTAIRSQMNPHFIFNAMGSIQNLINQNKAKQANLYLSSFARLMRMVLTNSNKKLVSLSDELELIEHYLELEQLRVDFQFKISLDENIDPETEEIPGMLVQPFVENAVIHGITPKGKGNILVLFSKDNATLVCEIIDDGIGINTSGVGNGNGMAMKLSEKRLNLLNSQLQTKLRLKVENRRNSEQTEGTKITLLIPVG